MNLARIHRRVACASLALFWATAAAGVLMIVVGTLLGEPEGEILGLVCVGLGAICLLTIAAELMLENRVMTNDRPSPLRRCDACWAYVDADGDGPAWCQRCEPGLMAAEEQLSAANPRVCLYGERHDRLFIVLDRHGDTISVRPFGEPQATPTITTIERVRPRFSRLKLDRIRGAQW